MRAKLIARILAAPPLRLADLRPGDYVQGFEAWGCIPDNARRKVQRNRSGLFVACYGPEDARSSVPSCHHYLHGQLADDGTLPGMIRVPAPRRRVPEGGHL